MLRKLASLAAIGFLAAALPLAAAGRGAPDRGSDWGERRAERLTRALDLTADQQTAFHRQLDDLRAEIAPLVDQLRATRAELETLLAAPARDAKAIGDRTIAADALRQKMRAAWERFNAEFSATLTETQRTSWEAIQKLRRDRGEERGFGRRFGRDELPERPNG
ncbi:MAG: periplasmic heavy metal sensor [Thermoanaerobaculia bacterium]